MDNFFENIKVKNIFDETLNINETINKFYNLTITYISIYGIKEVKEKIIFVINFIIDNKLNNLTKESNEILYELIKICNAFPLLSKINKEFIKELKGNNYIDYLILNMREFNNFYYNDKQINIYENIWCGERDIVFSAPTSYGKTHLSLVSILDMFKFNKVKNLLIVVPSKALINEYRKKLITLNLSEDISIHSTPYLNKENLSERNIFIYTQERALIAINQFEMNNLIDILLIDEAQILAETLNNRAILLMKLLTNFIDIPKIYLVPYVKSMYENVINTVVNSNKEIFETTIKSNENMVSNNKYIIDLLPENNIILYDSTFAKNFSENIKIKEINKKQKYIEPSYEQAISDIIQNYKEFNIKESKSIFYIASKNESINVAYVMYNLLEEKNNEEMSNRIKALIKHLKDNIHEEFNLIEFIKKGIAYHNAYLDNYTRRQLEYIIADKEEGNFLDKLICTNTLEGGVNLNAKNIFIFIKQSLKGDNPELKFANILGRAARISANTQGNLFYVKMKSNSKYEREFYVSSEMKQISNKKVKVEDFLQESNLAFRTMITDIDINNKIKEKFLSNEEIEINEKSIIVKDNEYKTRKSNGLDYYIEDSIIDDVERAINSLTSETINKYLNCLGNYEETKDFVAFLANIYKWDNISSGNLKNIMKDIDLITTMLNYISQGKSVKDIVNYRIKQVRNKEYKLHINISRNWVKKVKFDDNSTFYGYELLDENNTKHINVLIVNCLDLLQNLIEYDIKKYIQDFIFRVKKIASNEYNTEKMGNFVEFSSTDNKKVFLMENGIIDSFALNEFVKSEYNQFFEENKINYEELLSYIQVKHGMDSPFYYEIYDLIKS